MGVFLSSWYAVPLGNEFGDTCMYWSRDLRATGSCSVHHWPLSLCRALSQSFGATAKIHLCSVKTQINVQAIVLLLSTVDYSAGTRVALKQAVIEWLHHKDV